MPSHFSSVRKPAGPPTGSGTVLGKKRARLVIARLKSLGWNNLLVFLTENYTVGVRSLASWSPGHRPHSPAIASTPASLPICYMWGYRSAIKVFISMPSSVTLYLYLFVLFCNTGRRQGQVCSLIWPIKFTDTGDTWGGHWQTLIVITNWK